ncbi:MAG: monoheme cytochrome C [Bacteroidia bacterium]|nr:monoheme cytochrome C [Bacteroidia bacterium]
MGERKYNLTDEEKSKVKSLVSFTSYFLFSCLAIISIVTYIMLWYVPEINTATNDQIVEDKVENGIDLSTGLIADEGYKMVKQQCISCHSSKLIIQNRATKEGWTNIIQWMQETQNLWDLGKNEEIIVNYLAKNYAPDEQGRRKPLENIDWYVLKQ